MIMRFLQFIYQNAIPPSTTFFNSHAVQRHWDIRIYLYAPPPLRHSIQLRPITFHKMVCSSSSSSLFTLLFTPLRPFTSCACLLTDCNKADTGLPSGWEVRHSNSKNLPYYFNEAQKQSRWEPPSGTDTEKLKAYMAEHHSQREIAPDTSGLNGNANSGKIRAAHLLIKHKDSRRPSSWRQVSCVYGNFKLLLTFHIGGNHENKRRGIGDSTWSRGEHSQRPDFSRADSDQRVRLQQR